MKYAFILGRVYTLSVAELVAVLEKPDQSLILTPLRTEVDKNGPDESVKILEASEEVIIIETPGPLNVINLQKKLGGVVKILEIVDIIKKREADSVNFALKHYFKPSVLKKQFFKEYKGKMQFGVSIYILDMNLLKRPERNPNDRNQGAFNSIFAEPVNSQMKKILEDIHALFR